MDFALKLIFTGLIAFVPFNSNNKPLYVDEKTGEFFEAGGTVAQQPDHVWVLMVDARNPPQHTNAAHNPALRIRKANLADPNVVDLDCLDESHVPGVCGVIRLDDVEIEFPAVSAPLPAQFLTAGKRVLDGITGEPRARPCCTNPNDSECKNETLPERKCWNQTPDAIEQISDFSWLISVSEVAPGASLKPASWSSTATPAGPVSARLKLTRTNHPGTLESRYLEREVPCGIAADNERYLKTEPVTFAHLPTGTNWQDRAVAKEMEFTLTGLQNSVTLTLKPLPWSTGQPETIVIRPTQQGEVVVLEVTNSPEDYLKDRCARVTPRLHFEMLWDLVESPASPRPVPQYKQPPITDLLCPEVRP